MTTQRDLPHLPSQTNKTPQPLFPKCYRKVLLVVLLDGPLNGIFGAAEDDGNLAESGLDGAKRLELLPVDRYGFAATLRQLFTLVPFFCSGSTPPLASASNSFLIVQYEQEKRCDSSVMVMAN
jgi:hypothetical protein